MNEPRVDRCSLGEALIYRIARTIEDGILAFHGFGSPLVQLALHVAKRTHAPNLVLVAGATYAVNPMPPFLAPTSNDWVMDRGAECRLDIEELFDLAAAGRLGRMFLSGLQIDRWGNLNTTRLGTESLKLKLPGGGGGCNLACDARHLTLWTAAHRAVSDGRGARRLRLVERCDFITSPGHRAADGRTRKGMGLVGNGPDWLITELGVFDFDESGHVRLREVFPDTDTELVRANTAFEFPISEPVATTPLPPAAVCELIRSLDPLRIHERELRPEDRSRTFSGPDCRPERHA
ncbi:CoA-transferase [Methylotetracoccus oryzae]|uniref:CoA-transferase n=1 Tax=Methylotetracoccus oryzae TaxID=1919059 RepID=UPI0011188160|nr:CoA-transferase [Methylotetracoccus oryzae]